MQMKLVTLMKNDSGKKMVMQMKCMIWMKFKHMDNGHLHEFSFITMQPISSIMRNFLPFILPISSLKKHTLLRSKYGARGEKDELI
jgi:hypothetical protein